MAGPLQLQDFSTNLLAALVGTTPTALTVTTDLHTLAPGHYSVEGAVSTTYNHPYTLAYAHFTILVLGQTNGTSGYRVIICIDSTTGVYIKHQGWDTWGTWQSIKSVADLMPFATITSNTDANTYLTNGIYQLASNGSTLTNFPTTAGGVLIVSPGSHDKWITQQYNAQNGKMYYRASTDSSGTRVWNAWVEIAGTTISTITLLNGWVNNVGDTRISKTGNTVTINATLGGGTYTLNTIFANVPVGFRPSVTRYVSCFACNASYTYSMINVQIYADGTVLFDGTPAGNTRLVVNITYTI